MSEQHQKEKRLQKYINELEEELGELKGQYDHLNSLFQVLCAAKVEAQLTSLLKTYYYERSKESQDAYDRLFPM